MMDGEANVERREMERIGAMERWRFEEGSSIC